MTFFNVLDYLLIQKVNNIVINRMLYLRDSFPFILIAISDIFIYTDFSVYPKPDLEIQYRDLLQKISNLSEVLDLSNENDVEYGNYFYECLSKAYTGYAKVYISKEDLYYQKLQLSMLNKLSYHIKKLYPKISDSLISSYIETSKQFAENCLRRNNVVLLGFHVENLFKFGLENVKCGQLRKKIEEALKFLKSK